VKLSFKETRELQALPEVISALEAEQQLLASKMSAPDYFRQPPDILRADQARSAEIEKLERWEVLEAKAKAAAFLWQGRSRPEVFIGCTSTKRSLFLT
jgi:ATP-binding cassette subfamily F protein uup